MTLLLGGGYFGFKVFEIELKARVAQPLLQYAWHKTIKTGEDQRPWRSFDGVPVLRLMIPRHEVDQIVLSGTSGQALAFGPAFHEESKLPGKGGATVLSSHRDSHGVYIRQLKKGDTIKPTNTKEVLLIITCYPFNALTSATPLRYVVSASQNVD